MILNVDCLIVILIKNWSKLVGFYSKMDKYNWILLEINQKWDDFNQNLILIRIDDPNLSMDFEFNRFHHSKLESEFRSEVAI